MPLHPVLSTSDWFNLGTLLLIFLVNIWILSVLNGKKGVGAVQDELLAHVFWTANWLVWLFAWIAHFKSTSLVLPDVLDDVGAFLLIAFALAFTAGAARLKAYSILLGALFVFDLLWLVILGVVMGWEGGMDYHTLGDLLAAKDPLADTIILHRTVLFAPSLCLVILALGFVAWSFIHRVGQGQLSSLMACLTGAYALLHVVFFQANFFVPGMSLHQSVEVLFLLWRVVLVLLYVLLILSSVGIEVPLQRLIAGAGTVLGVVSSLLALKHYFLGK